MSFAKTTDAKDPCPFCHAETRDLTTTEYIQHLEDHVHDAPYESEDRVSLYECTAMRCLYAEGWRCRQIAQVMDRTHNTVARHVFDECPSHRELKPSPPERLGNIPSFRY